MLLSIDANIIEDEKMVNKHHNRRFRLFVSKNIKPKQADRKYQVQGVVFTKQIKLKNHIPAILPDIFSE